MVKYLVEQGANIYADHDCALRYAIQYGHLDIVDYLKSKMFDKNAILFALSNFFSYLCNIKKKH